MQETIAMLSHKQKLNTVVDLVSNLQVLQDAVRLLNGYKSDMLDEEGTSSAIAEQARELEVRKYKLSLKLDALMSSLELKN